MCVNHGHNVPGHKLSSQSWREHELQDKRLGSPPSHPYQQPTLQLNLDSNEQSHVPKPHLDLMKGQINIILCYLNLTCIVVVSPVFEFCCLVVAGLSLHAGISRKTANTVLRAFQFIMSTTLGLIQIALASAGIQATVTGKINIPSDIHTLYAHVQLEPDILSVVCCSRCCKQYPTDGIPLQCTY
jgi:hypothetical protein